MLGQRMKVPLIPRLLSTAIRVSFGAELPLWRKRPEGLILMHNAQSVVIHPETRFLGPAVVFHQTTFGNSWSLSRQDGAPTVGRYVFVGVGAKILGGITVGDYCVIGANCVLTKDLPTGHMAVGNPAVARSIDRTSLLATVFGIDENAESNG